MHRRCPQDVATHKMAITFFTVVTYATKEKCKITSDNSNLNCDLTFSNHVKKSLKIKSKLK